MSIEHVCPVCGRLHTYKTKDYLCKKHLQQLKKFGKFLDTSPRTKFDPNEIRIIENICELDVYDLSGNVIQTFKFDAEDYQLVSKYKWSLSKEGYCRTGAKSMFLHRLIMGAPEGAQVDHINLDITDNRKCNLRICQNGLNSANRKPYNKWNLKGVEQHRSGKWSAYIRKDNKQYHSPTFDTQEEAAFARYLLEQHYYPNDVLTQHGSYALTPEQKQQVIQRVTHKLNN
jgi:hypothetical protein